MNFLETAEKGQSSKMTTRVIVYVLTSDSQLPQAKRTVGLFQTPFFDVKTATFTTDANKDQPISSAVELERIRQCLEDAATNNPDKPVLIVKDTSTSAYPPAVIAAFVAAALNAQDWDLTYLSKYGDRCDLYKERQPIGNTGVSLVQSTSPNGLQALLISPRGRDIILGRSKLPNGTVFSAPAGLNQAFNSLTQSGQLRSLSTDQNVINYDMSFAKQDSDYAKNNTCAPPNSGWGSGAMAGGFLILILFILLLVFLFMRKR